jgi:Polyketide cyclase / dehydrase and lipid transport
LVSAERPLKLAVGMMRHFFRLFFALATLGVCLQVRSAEPEASPAEWKFISNKEGIALFRRDRPVTQETKAVGEIGAPAAAIHAVINDVDSYARFMPYTAECRVLKREGNSILAYQRISAPLTSDRDYTVRMRFKLEVD